MRATTAGASRAIGILLLVAAACCAAAVAAYLLFCATHTLPELVSSRVLAVRDPDNVGIAAMSTQSGGVARETGTLYIVTHDINATDSLVMLEHIRERQRRDPAARFSLVSRRQFETQILVMFTAFGLLRADLLYREDGDVVNRASRVLSSGGNVIVQMHPRWLHKTGAFYMHRNTGCRVVVARVCSRGRQALHPILRGLTRARSEWAQLEAQAGHAVDVEYREARFAGLDDFRRTIRALYDDGRLDHILDEQRQSEEQSRHACARAAEGGSFCGASTWT